MKIVEIQRDGKAIATIESFRLGDRWFVRLSLDQSQSSVSQGPYASETAADLAVTKLSGDVERDFQRRHPVSRHVVMFRDETETKEYSQ